MIFCKNDKIDSGKRRIRQILIISALANNMYILTTCGDDFENEHLFNSLLPTLILEKMLHNNNKAKLIFMVYAFLESNTFG